MKARCSSCLIGLALLSAACSEPSANRAQIELEPQPATTEAASVAAPSPVEGWATPAASAPTLIPADLSLSATDGSSLTAEALRDNWTIVAFWGLWSEDSIADLRYMQALRSATSQDPGLDFLAVHIPQPGEEREAPYGAYLSLEQGLADQGAPFPTAEDKDGEAASALSITSAPTYLLVGPDLAIEAQRGALSPDDTDGVKSMLRGVAEIKRQIAAP